MFRLEYNSKQRAYHVAHISEPLKEGWNVIMDNTSRQDIDKEYYKLIKKRK